MAPLSLRAGALVSGAAPELAASLGRRFGAAKLSAAIGAGQTDKR